MRGTKQRCPASAIESRQGPGNRETVLHPIPALPEIVTVQSNGTIIALDNAQIREVVKARTIAGSVCVTLPKALRDYLGIDSGDRLMISLDKVNRYLVVTKE